MDSFIKNQLDVAFQIAVRLQLLLYISANLTIKKKKN